MLPISEFMSIAKARLSKGWTRAVLARDQTGREVDPSSDTACKWCAVGALCAARNAMGKRHTGEVATACYMQVVGTLEGLTLRKYGAGIANSNDGHAVNSQEVLEWFDEAERMICGSVK